MEHLTRDELEEALQALTSLLGKCEKVLPKLRSGTAQRTLLENRIKALRIASSLVEQALREPLP